MGSLRSSSQLKFSAETAVSWRRRWQKAQSSILLQKLCTRDGALAVRSDRLNFQGLGLRGFRRWGDLYTSYTAEFEWPKIETEHFTQ
jgi:hypothetical protein